MPAKQSDPKPVKPRKAWAIVTPSGNIDVYSVHQNESEVWDDCQEMIRQKATREDMQEQGYRVVRVVIQEDQDES